MDRSRTTISIALLMAAGLAGCRGGYDTDVLERELRHQEDQIYQLQDALDEAQARLDATRRENDAMRRELGLDKTSAQPLETGGPPAHVTPPEVVPPADAPLIEPGAPVEVPNLQFPPGVLPGDASPPTEPMGLFQRRDEPLSSAPVDQIVFNKMLTGGLNTDGRPGDEGVMVVIEPRSAEGELVRPVGDISLMLVDPARGQPEGRVARWDFSNEEAQLAWKRTLLGRGMHFEVLWPGRPPADGTYELWARLLTPDGEKHLARMTIRIDPPSEGGVSQRRTLDGAAADSSDGFVSRQPDASGWSRRIVPAEPAVVDGPSTGQTARHPPVRVATPPRLDAAASPAKSPAAALTGATSSAQTADTAARPAWQPYR